jgi:Kef-type K+ transport system membrane component KefB
MDAHIPAWLTYTLIYLSAAAIAVPLSKWLGLGSIIGYLAAGVAIGPFGLGLIKDTQATLHFAEFGVVLMLFVVGLELEPRRLRTLRKPGRLNISNLGNKCFGFVLLCQIDESAKNRISIRPLQR